MEDTAVAIEQTLVIQLRTSGEPTLQVELLLRPEDLALPFETFARRFLLPAFCNIVGHR